MESPNFKIKFIDHPRSCSNCAFCRKNVFSYSHYCALNKYVDMICMRTPYEISNPYNSICENFFPFDVAARMDEVESLEEFRLLDAVGTWDGASAFVKECKMNFFLEDDSATQKQLMFAELIASKSKKLPPISIMGCVRTDDAVGKRQWGDYIFNIANSRPLVGKYISDNIDLLDGQKDEEPLSLSRLAGTGIFGNTKKIETV